MDSTDANTLYVGACKCLVYVSSNAGDSFSPLAQIPGIDRIIALAVPPAAAGVILAGSPEGLFRSTDGGMTWQETLDVHAHSAQVAPSNPEVVYLGTQRGVYRSADGGKTWTRRIEGIIFEDMGPLTIHPQDENVVLVGNNIWQWSSHGHSFPTSTKGEGIYKTADGGLSWVRKSGGFQDVDVVAVAVQPDNPDVAYVGVECSRGIFRTLDGGATWQFFGGGPDEGDWDIGHYTMRLATDSDGNLWLTGRFGLARSSDRGETWEQFLVRRHFHGIAIHPENPRVVFVGTSPKQDPTEADDYPGGRILYTVDGGQTWQEPVGGFPQGIHTSIHHFAFDPFDQDTVYVTTSRHEIGLPPTQISVGIYKSTDLGMTWQEINVGLPTMDVDTIVASPAQQGLLFAGTHEGIFRSEDGGANWQGTTMAQAVSNLVIDPMDADSIFAGAETGLFWSPDAGVTWQRVESVPHKPVPWLAMDEQGEALYAVVNEEGVYKGVK